MNSTASQPIGSKLRSKLASTEQNKRINGKLVNNMNQTSFMNQIMHPSSQLL